MSLVRLPPTWARFLELVHDNRLPGISLGMLQKHNEELREVLMLEEGESWPEPVIELRFADFLMAQIRRDLRREGWHAILHPDSLSVKHDHSEGSELQWHVDAAIAALE